jgi:hypothetical protein
MEPWVSKRLGDVRTFELIDEDLLSPLYEDVIVEASPTEPDSVEYLSSLTEDEIVEA